MASRLIKAFDASTVRCLSNPQAAPNAPYAQRRWLSRRQGALALAEMSVWPGYAVTPLRRLKALEPLIPIDCLWYKDESSRFGLGSFKALGGAYAVFRQLSLFLERAGYPPPIRAVDLRSGRYADAVSGVTVTTATDGNHGRSVAWGAQQFGCGCVVYLPEGASAGREAAIATYAARTVRVAGSYDVAVRQAAADAASHGWILVSDTSEPDYTAIPCDVMQGYTAMAEEMLHQLPQRPTHVLVQAGVGGLAAAICAHFWEVWDDTRPRFIVVEPAQAACVTATAERGQRVELPGSIETVMACLSSGHTSWVAWEILQQGADFFITIPDGAAVEAMGILAGLSPPIVAGESGAAGVAAVLALAQRPDLRQQLGITPESRLLALGTEGATDPQIYQQIVGSRING